MLVRLPMVLVFSSVAALLASCSSTQPVVNVSPSNPDNAEQLAAGARTSPGNLNTLGTPGTPTSPALLAKQLGGATINITRVTYASEGADFDPCISGNGSHLYFVSTQHRPTSDIYVKRVDSKVLTQLTSDPADDSMPAISPDGTKLAFASNRSGNWDIYIMPAAGGKAVQVTGDASDETHPSWSPDGQRLVYCRYNDGGESANRWELWITKAGNNATANFIGYGVAPRWCPVAGTGENASDKILFQLSRERGRRGYGLWTLDYAEGISSNITQIQGASDVALLHPTWSADGAFIAYSQVDLLDPANRADRPTNASLWMTSIAGDATVRLTSGEGAALSPAWSANNVLYYVSGRTGTDNIWALELSPALGAAQAVLDLRADPATTTTDAQATTDARGTAQADATTGPGTDPQN